LCRSSGSTCTRAMLIKPPAVKASMCEHACAVVTCAPKATHAPNTPPLAVIN
jgi:hypothetical protein